MAASSVPLISQNDSTEVRSVRRVSSSAFRPMYASPSWMALMTSAYWSSAVIIAATPVFTSPLPRSIASSAFFIYLPISATHLALRLPISSSCPKSALFSRAAIPVSRSRSAVRSRSTRLASRLPSKVNIR